MVGPPNRLGRTPCHGQHEVTNTSSPWSKFKKGIECLPAPKGTAETTACLIFFQDFYFFLFFIQCGTLFSRHFSLYNFYISEHYQLWMMDRKAQRVFFAKTQKLCALHTDVSNCYNFHLGMSHNCESQNGECWLTG